MKINEARFAQNFSVTRRNRLIQVARKDVEQYEQYA
jgi:predicted transcriptional regulator